MLTVNQLIGFGVNVTDILPVSISVTATPAGNDTGIFSALALGAEDPGRRIVICAGAEANTDFTTCTVGGVSATLLLNLRDTGAGPDNVAAIWVVNYPTGTSAEIVVSSAGGRCVAVYRLTGGFGLNGTALGSQAAPPSIAFTMAARSATIVSFCTNGTGDQTYSNATLVVNRNVGGNDNFSTAYRLSTVAESVTIATTSGETNAAMVGCNFY